METRFSFSSLTVTFNIDKEETRQEIDGAKVVHNDLALNIQVLCICPKANEYETERRI